MASGRWERRGRGTRAINVQAVVGSGGGDEVAGDGGRRRCSVGAQERCGGGSRVLLTRPYLNPCDLRFCMLSLCFSAIFLRKARRLRWLARPGSVALPADPEFESHQKRIFRLLGEKKTPSLCSPQGLALLGMGQGSGGFSTRLAG